MRAGLPNRSRCMSPAFDRLAISAADLAAFASGSSPSHQAQALLRQQKESWGLLRAGYETLRSVRTRIFEFDGFHIKVQFNLGRFVSTAAKVDAQSIRERKCFLCVENLPEGQRGIPYDGQFHLLCNPFPIFPEHFTIPFLRHVPQRLENSWEVFLRLCQALGDRYTVFYNGPRCGASAPDHLHFQAGDRSFLPIDAEYASVSRAGRVLFESRDLRVVAIEKYLRRVVAFESTRMSALMPALQALYAVLQAGGTAPEEPMLNVLGFWGEPGWRVLVIPRARHRPGFYFKEGEEKLLISPAAVELGGVCTTPRECDFEKVTREQIIELFEEVCVSPDAFGRIQQELVKCLASA